jgi:Histidine kinase/Two component regulator propeller
MNKYVFILLLLACGKFSFAQINEASLVNITKQEGLPSNETYCVFKDSKNYIWIATDQGVVRHKGSTMQVINNLPDNVVFKIREDNRGRVWFFSHTGRLAYFFNEKLYPFIYNDSITKYIKQLLINDAYFTHVGEIVLNSVRFNHNFKVTKNGTIIKDYNFNSDKQKDTCIIEINKGWNNRQFVQILNPHTVTFYTHFKVILNDGNKPFIYNYKYRELGIGQFGAFRNKENEVFFWIDKFIMKLKKDGSYEVRVFPARILCALNDTVNNTIILGFAKGGIAITDRQLNVLGRNVINNYSVSSVEKDNEGELWFSTLENGVYYTKNSNRQKEYIKMICPTPAQRLINVKDSFVAFANTDGVFKLAVNNIVPLLKEKNSAVGDIKLSRKNDFYYARVNNISNKNFHSGYAGSFINNIISFQSAYEILPLGKDSFCLHNGSVLSNIRLVYNGKTKVNFVEFLRTSINEHKVTAILKKDSNTFILGTQKSLLNFDISTKNVSPFKDTANLFAKGITCMRQMPDGIYAIGIRFGGLALMQDSTVIGNITEADGLLSNSIKYILPLGNRLWLATPSGISVVQFSSYSPLKYTITNFGENVGLNNLIIYQLISFKNNILAATSKGIYELSNIEEVLKQTPLSIPLYITNLSYYKGDTSGIGSITLPYKYNRLVVNFDAVCYNTPKELKHYYRLSRSNDTAWNNISSTQIILENLEPGNYDLQIKAEMPKQQRYSVIQTLKITIEKPWWQWNLIRLAAILVLLLLAYILYQWRINIIKKRESEKTVLKTQMLQLEQTALRSQMNPHFIFNCLSSIQQLVVAGNKEEANDYLVKFSQLIRKTLELSANPYITIAQEKEYLLEYLVLEQLRMPNKFDFNFTIANYIDAYKTEIPNMMLQPIVENSIRHGIKHLQNRNGKINIAITQVNNCLHCEVTDNGIGRKEAGSSVTLTSHKSYGMDIVEKRLKGLQAYDAANCFIEIMDITDENNLPLGTKVILQLPFKTNVI